MVCPNCHSNDIVLIQNQNYCINCGQMVPRSAVKTAAKPAIKAVTKPVAATARPKPQVRRLSDLKAAKPAGAVATLPKPIVEAPARLAVTVAPPKPPITPTRASPAAASKPTPQPGPKTIKPVILSPARQARQAILLPALSAASEAEWDAHYLPAGLAVASLSLAPVWLVAALLLRGITFTDLWQGQLTDLGLYLAAGAVIYHLGSYLVSNVISSSMIFSYAKNSENRPVTPAAWWRSGYNSLPAQLGLDLICLIFTASLAAVAVATLQNLPAGPIRAAALGLLGLEAAMIWLFRLAAASAVVVGACSTSDAFSTGRRLVSRHPLDWTLTGLVGLLGIGLILPAYFGAAYATRLILAAAGHPNAWAELAAGIVASSFFYGLIRVFGWLFRLELYRRSVRQLSSAKSNQLLSGHQPDRVRPAAAVLFAALAAVALGGLALTSWQPLLTVNFLHQAAAGLASWR